MRVGTLARLSRLNAAGLLKKDSTYVSKGKGKLWASPDEYWANQKWYDNTMAYHMKVLARKVARLIK